MAKYPLQIETYAFGAYWHDVSGSLSDAQTKALSFTTSGFITTETVTTSPSGEYTRIIPAIEIRRISIFPQQ